MNEFFELYESRKQKIDEFLNKYWSERSAPAPSAFENLKNSIQYSTLDAGKRFRPVLSLFFADSFAAGPQKVLPFAAAVELIHTYSLIHDDLPCMDDDEIRRGKPTNHKVFGESMALLAGDALQTEAFAVIASQYGREPETAVKLLKLLCEACGFSGMVGGQAMDLFSKAEPLSQADLELMHSLKTGALIRVSVEGAAVILGLPSELQEKARTFGAQLGLAFQLQDDLLDSKENIEPGSFPALLGAEPTKKYLVDITQKAHQTLKLMQIESGPLHEMLEMNLHRET